MNRKVIADVTVTSAVHVAVVGGAAWLASGYVADAAKTGSEVSALVLVLGGLVLAAGLVRLSGIIERSARQLTRQALRRVL